MKKDGSSNSRSKTPRISKNSGTRSSASQKKGGQAASAHVPEPKSKAELLAQTRGSLPTPEVVSSELAGLGAALVESLAVGHRPLAHLSIQDDALFRAFQSNLLSLISHELRTPLMGVMNALTVLEEGVNTPEFEAGEWVRMARQNAHRLQRALVALLDLAALESGNFHVRLREVDLVRLLQSRIQTYESALKDRKLKYRTGSALGDSQAILLADPQKLGRAIDLCFEIIIPRAEAESAIDLRISSNSIRFQFELMLGTEKLWDTIWSQSLAGFESGIASPSSAFAGVLQSEQAFLTRMEEGLGSEFLLVHEIARLHRGKLTGKRDQRHVTLMLEVAEISDEEGLRAVLSSRVYEVSTALGSVSLILIQNPEGIEQADFLKHIKQNLFRSSDAVYALPARSQVAIVLDDCKPDDAPKLMQRIGKNLKRELVFGLAHCPTEGLDPAALFEVAEKRLKKGARS